MGLIFDEVVALFFRHHPTAINFDDNTDAYLSEAPMVLPRSGECHSTADVQRVVPEEFVRWFDSGTAGPMERYAAVAEQLWQLWQARLTSDTVRQAAINPLSRLGKGRPCN